MSNFLLQDRIISLVKAQISRCNPSNSWILVRWNVDRIHLIHDSTFLSLNCWIEVVNLSPWWHNQVIYNLELSILFALYCIKNANQIFQGALFKSRIFKQLCVRRPRKQELNYWHTYLKIHNKELLFLCCLDNLYIWRIQEVTLPLQKKSDGSKSKRVFWWKKMKCCMHPK